MEETVNEGEAQHSFGSPPRRRRSTFFERRESIVPQPVPENVNVNTCKGPLKMEEKHTQTLQRYRAELLSEKEQWKKEVKERRNNYHDLRQQCQMATKSNSRSRISYAVLSNEDIEFVKAKCNISKLFESQQKLHKSVKETRALYRRACELDDVILSQCEDKVNTIIDYIFENSTIE